ncbi:hypothetical protein ACSETL_34765 [Pseudomonas aeruginosa]
MRGVLAILASLVFVFSGWYFSTTGNAESKENPQFSFTLCEDRNSATKLFYSQIKLLIKEAWETKTDPEMNPNLSQVYKRVGLTSECKYVTAAEQDLVFTPNFYSYNGLAERVIAFEIYIVDANCERQCPNKFGGWASSYELPQHFWPKGEGWLTAYYNNRQGIHVSILKITAANRVFLGMDKYDTQGDRDYMRKVAMKGYSEGTEFLKTYGVTPGAPN